MVVRACGTATCADPGTSSCISPTLAALLCWVGNYLICNPLRLLDVNFENVNDRLIQRQDLQHVTKSTGCVADAPCTARIDRGLSIAKGNGEEPTPNLRWFGCGLVWGWV